MKTFGKRWTISMAMAVTILAGTAHAEDHPYREGPVVNVASIRTEYGKFYLAEPRNDKEPDIYLVITYKNWAALDDATAKADAVVKQVEGTLAKSNQAAVDRGKIRTVLGSETMQELVLK